ncbi:MAG TPA: EI24 domain-containing protein, partial [Pseudobdellovibrionaceae bacterium]|jgi:MFS family permease
MIIGLVLFFTLGTWSIAQVSGGLEQSWFMQYILQKWSLMNHETAASISYFIFFLFAILLIIPLSYLLSVLLVSQLLLPSILKIIEKKDFPELEKKKGGSLSYGFWNTLKASGVYLISLVVTLPLWLFPGFAVVWPVLLSSYLNKTVFVYDVLEDFASEEERKYLEKEHGRSLYVLGIILGFINYIPLTFIVVPTFSGLAYSYFCLNALKDLRKNKL